MRLTQKGAPDKIGSALKTQEAENSYADKTAIDFIGLMKFVILSTSLSQKYGLSIAEIAGEVNSQRAGKYLAISAATIA